MLTLTKQSIPIYLCLSTQWQCHVYILSMGDCETSVIVNTPYLDILAGPGDHLGEELGVVGVEGVVGGLAAGQGRGLRGLLQDAHAVA